MTKYYCCKFNVFAHKRKKTIKYQNYYFAVS